MRIVSYARTTALRTTYNILHGGQTPDTRPRPAVNEGQDQNQCLKDKTQSHEVSVVSFATFEQH